jgi:RNA polymerase-binding protein DksA
MDQIFIDKMEEALLELKREILNKLAESSKDFRTIAEGTEAKDLVDAASDDIDKKMIETLGSKEQNRLKLIDNAIVRIKGGKYGLCMKCGKRISQNRLEAIPYALMCVDCQSQDERSNR